LSLKVEVKGRDSTRRVMNCGRGETNRVTCDQGAFGLAETRCRSMACSRRLNRRASSQVTITCHNIFTMTSIRLSRAALHARFAVGIRPVQRRGYADAVSDKIKLSLALPHSVCTQAKLQYICTRSPGRFHAYVLTFMFSRLSTNRPMCTNPSPSVHYRIVLQK
jgi:hypothetical protein